MDDERIDIITNLLKAAAPIIVAVAAEPILLAVIVSVTATLACVTVTFWLRDKYA